jgi:hypothetical protein
LITTCVSLTITNGNGFYLAQLRADQPGYWPIIGKIEGSIPSSASDLHKLALSEIVRETHEEVELVDSHLQISPHFYTWPSNSGEFVTYCFYGFVSSTPRIVTKEDKHKPFKWVARNRMIGVYEGEAMILRTFHELNDFTSFESGLSRDWYSHDAKIRELSKNVPSLKRFVFDDSPVTTLSYVDYVDKFGVPSGHPDFSDDMHLSYNFYSDGSIVYADYCD